MSKDHNLIISGRRRDLGGFSVARTIPYVTRRHVGPFVFLDHMGPMHVDDQHKLDVRPHPHIGLSTVTYLFSGKGFHRDSLGYAQEITPGDVNWMTAGKGIVHSERTPETELHPASQTYPSIHGIQVWVALPIEFEDMDPNFTHYPKSDIPHLNFGTHLQGTLIIGSHKQVTSPVHSYSRTFFADIKVMADSQETIFIEEQEMGIILVEGNASINGHRLALNDLIVLTDLSHGIKIHATQNTRLIIIGGTPFSEPRYIWWNLVSSSKEKIKAAAKQWEKQEMGHVIGETDYIPLPNIPFP